MKFPFHGVQVCGNVLFATGAGNIHSFNLSDGSHISCWKYPLDPKDQKARLVIDVSETSTPAPEQQDEQKEQEPPSKRARLDESEAGAGNDGAPVTTTTPAEAPSDQASKKGVGKKNKKHDNKTSSSWSSSAQPSDRPMVIIMAATPDASHLVAVSSDKSVWVFAHNGQGELVQLSRRRMPKRPCSIVLTPDNKDILVADKFGDVYSVPLIAPEEPQQQQQQEQQQNPPQTAGQDAQATPSPPPPPPAAAAKSSTPTPTPPFFPQANEFTVHTKRNRQALLDQLTTRNNPNAHRGGTPRRVDEAFERHLLLGHVSLLTAITLGHDYSTSSSSSSNNTAEPRRYIITADRDEHIRISRGTREQAHVIEAFCLGHDEFVNRLCVPTSTSSAFAQAASQLLVSGGGDNDVFVWRWQQGQLVSRADLLGPVKQVVPEATKVAVTGLWSWKGDGQLGEGETRIVVTCERVPALFIYTLHLTSGSLAFTEIVTLPGNPLDVAAVEGNGINLIVPVDPTSLKQQDSPQTPEKHIFKIERVDSSGSYKAFGALLQPISDPEDTLGVDISSDELQGLLYTTETLRKLDFGDAEKDGGAEE